MPTSERRVTALACGALLVAGAALVASFGQDLPRRTLGGGTPGTKQGLGSRDCLGCHKDFAAKYVGLPHVHAGVKDGGCETCHLRHGLVAKRVMKKDGNDLCYTCHSQDALGLNKAHVHAAAKSGSCVGCHNPHASRHAHLLSAEPTRVCYQCHDRAAYEQRSVHAVLQAEGCSACHSAHGSDQPGLLVRDERTLCLGCHQAAEPSFAKAHGGYPVERASCSTCHSPHSSAQPKL
nr:cytochrome c3 family protein [Vicinamibacterales bacterium]